MNQSNKLTFTILSISLLTVMAGAAIAPALGVIHEHFAGHNSMMVQLIISPLTGLLGSPTAPYVIGMAFGIVYLIQAFCSRRYQALSPAGGR